MPGSLVMAMTVRRSSAEARHDNLRTELPNDADEISKQCVSPPLFKSLVRTLGETELINRREELLCVIGPASRKKFLGADNAKGFEEFSTQEVLTAITARGRKVGRPGAFAARQPRK